MIIPEDGPARPGTPGETILVMDNVSVSFDGFKELNNLSFVVMSGQMRAVIGPNGAGKTTMMDVITGKTRPDLGTVTFREFHDLTRLDEPRIETLGIGRKFQKPTVFETLTVFENLWLTMKADRRVKSMFEFGASASQRALIRENLETIGLGLLSDNLAGALSHGQKQWLEIGMLLAQDPDLLLIDEPVACMTDAETEATAALLRKISDTHSVVVVEHDMEFVRALDVPVTVLHEGSVLAKGPLRKIQNDEQVIEVYLGR
jgi:urea transport system ATP-binding protein